MRDPDHRSLGDAGVSVEYLLDLARVHVVPTADDHVLFPINDEIKAVLISRRDISTMKPTVPNGLGGRVGFPEIPSHHVMPLDADLARLSSFFDDGPALIFQAEFHALDRDPNRAGLFRAVERVETSHWRGLRQPITFEDIHLVFLVESPHHLHRHRRSSRDTMLEAA